MPKAARFAFIVCCVAATLPFATARSARAADPPPDDGAKVQVLSVGQMSPADATLLAGRRSDLAAAAEFHGYDLSSGTWIVSQIACPYAPNYLILHDVQLHHEGSVSLFTALIPRSAGQVRIFPVLHHGAQALRVFGTTPAQKRLIDEVISSRQVAEAPNQNGDWTTLAYCYGALAGAEPASENVMAPQPTMPRISVGENSKVRELSFSVLGPDHVLQDWTIEFDPQGQVKSIALSARALHSPTQIPGPALPRSHVIPPSQASRATPIPQ
ncbi:MAG TPA: hypothetical protein VFE01_03915 [Terracidiphilus sp.]|nr:hypothetical protein [Terracidiphilus sp.]